MKLIAYVASFLFITSCSMDWVEKVRPDDYDQVSIDYKRVFPAPLMKDLSLSQCVKVEGLNPKIQIESLNSKNIFEFKSCDKAPITISYVQHTEGQLGINGKGLEMKNAIKSSGAGNTILGFLLLSSISTTAVSAKAKGTLVITANGQKFSQEFETADISVSTDDLSNLEKAIVQITDNFMWNKFDPQVENKRHNLKFESDKEYYHLFRWDLHYENYPNAHKNLAIVLKDHPDKGDVYFNRGLLYEVEKKHDLALKDYEEAAKLGFEKAIPYKDRLKAEMDYLVSLEKINPNIRKKL